MIEIIHGLKKVGTGILAIFHDRGLVARLADFEVKLS
jgi:alpha-D-ribose 1-methylphosphonate 5-triphosphate synthase subunit PhnL